MDSLILVAVAAMIVLGTILSLRSRTASPRPMTHAAELALDSDNASFWRRSGACLLDMLFISIINFVLRFAARDGIQLLILNLAANFGYFVLYWTTSGATPGKKLLGLKVIDASTGDVIGPRAAVLRWLGYFVSAIPFGFGFWSAIWDPERRAWHDKIAGTRVIPAVKAEERRTIVI